MTNVPVADVDGARGFYADYFGLSVEEFSLGWVARCTSPDGRACVQLVTRDATGREGSVLSVHVGDAVDEAYVEAQRRGYEIVDPLTDEPWGVRSFFVRDPVGNVATWSAIETSAGLARRRSASRDGGLTATAEPFDMVLSGTGTFRPVSPVVFVQVSRGIPNCEALERAVRSGPVERQLDFPYHPHVTVAHHLDEPALDRAFESRGDFRCAYRVASVELYHHDHDGVWRVIDSFALGG